MTGMFSEDPFTTASIALVGVAIVASYLYSTLFGSRKAFKSSTGQPAILAIGTAVPPIKVDKNLKSLFFDHLPHISDETKEFLKARLISNGIDYHHIGWNANFPHIDKDFQSVLMSNHLPNLPEEVKEVLMARAKNNSSDRNDCMSPYVEAKIDGKPDVEQRHEYWEEWSKKLSVQAARNAVSKWGGNKDRITHVVFHSCTGFKAPGVELDIVDGLGLKNVKRRLGINYMGCFGGFTGLSVAKSFALSDPNAVVLVVCCEICSAHLAQTEDRSKVIGNVIFSDGAAAAIIGPGGAGDWAIGEQMTHTLGKKTRSDMSWKPSNFQYDMFLDKDIGKSLGTSLFFTIKSIVRQVCPGITKPSDLEWCIHPGGRKILDVLCSGISPIGCSKEDLRHSYSTLRDYGNMSSGTIFFVIDRMMEEAKKKDADTKDTAFCLGFGPGLTVEIAALHKIEADTSEYEPLKSGKTRIYH